MVSYRYLIFGLGLAGIGIVLILLDQPVTLFLDTVATLSSSSESEASRTMFEQVYNGLAFVCVVLGMLFVMAGSLADRAQQNI